jgi:plasmid stability protein
MKRLTIDIPEDLHRRLKMDCAANGHKMADVVREMLSQKYGNK